MTVFLFIFFLLLITYAVLIDYYRSSWNQIPDFVADNCVGGPFISVIIPIRNEEKNLPTLIRSLRQQIYYPSLFEVIVVDDHSTDNSWNILQSEYRDPVTIRPVRLAEMIDSPENVPASKKLAIEKGIELAKGDLIVTTDADCIFDPSWLFTVASFYSVTKAKFIAAPVKIRSTFSFLSVFQSLDFLTLQGITGASVYNGFHTMCNGANLAYEKAAFYEVGGFKGIDIIPSGDDMLLMYKIYKQHPDQIFYLKSRQAIVITNPMNTWKGFFNQRIRWASKASHYDDKKIFWILLLVYAINFGFLVLGIASLWDATWLFFFVMLLIAKIVIEFPFVNTVAGFFTERKLMNYFLLMQPFHILYTIIAGWLGKFGSYEWKGKTYKT
jgi:cellulose synthase/poly-beta-1,6-N-acetylglucosamine synthase-like glycosyltransferase